MTGQYKVISDNLGEYSVVSKDNVLVATEIQHRITAETFCEELNILAEENEQLKQKLKKYEEIEELKKEDFINCHNCKNNRSVHDGVALDGMCAIKELMNLDGYFDTEYHELPSGTICPCWELEE